MVYIDCGNSPQRFFKTGGSLLRCMMHNAQFIMPCSYKAGSGSLRFGFHTGDLGAGVCGTGEEPPLGDSSPFLRLVVVGWLVIYLVGCQSYSCHPPERVIVSISNCVSLTEIYQSRLTSLLTIRQERILISAATKVSSSPGFSGSITSSGSYTGVPRPVRDLMFAL